MIETILIGLVVLAGIAFITLGITYVKTTNESFKSSCSTLNKQSYVKDNRTTFGVENRGTSMDRKKVYTVSPLDVGL